MANSPKSMSLNLFRAIVEKAKSEGYDLIGLYNWTEPFLSKKLPEFISIVKELGLTCHVSSNLSLKGRFDTIERSLAAGLDYLVVSVSGLNQEVYEINHRGGKISYVRENLEYISKLLQNNSDIKTKVYIKFIKFDYNMREELLLKEYANSLSIGFEMIDGVGHPNKPVNLICSEESFLGRIKNIIPSSIYEKGGEICSLILDTISIDCDGNAFLCCANPNYPVLRIGAYLDMTKSDILIKRYTHPVCKSCPGYRRKATANEIAMLDALMSRSDSSSFNDYERRLAELNNTLQTKVAQISILETSLQEKESVIATLEMQLRQIQRGIVMQLLSRYQRVVEKLLRPGTRRRQYYELVLAGIRVILNEGWRSYWHKFRQWYKQRE